MKTKECMKKLSVVLCVLVMVAVCSSTFGSTFQSNDGHNWSKAANWVWGNAPPTSSDDAVVNNQYWTSGTVIVDAPAVCHDLYVGNWASGSLDVQSSLTVSNDVHIGIFTNGSGTVSSSGSITASHIYVGQGDPGILNISAGSVGVTELYLGVGGGSGVLNMSGGAITATGLVHIGNDGTGTATVSGGTITTASLWLSSTSGTSTTGNLDLSGGVITTDYFNFGQNFGGGTGTLTLSATGKLVITNANMTPEAWKEYLNGQMGTGILNAQMNVVGNTLEITAIPEPATMVILGLGGLLAIRRKK